MTSELVQLVAIKNNGWVIEFIKNPSEQVQLEAVNHNKGYNIKYIKNPSEDIKTNGCDILNILKTHLRLLKIIN